MTIDAFIDTNVLLYAVPNSVKEIEKKWLARALLEKKNFGLSAQVLQEFYVNSTGKLAQTLPKAETMEFIRWLELTKEVPCGRFLLRSRLRPNNQPESRGLSSNSRSSPSPPGLESRVRPPRVAQA